jgi:hypothetical protein
MRRFPVLMRWAVVRKHDDKVLERCLTNRGAERARAYWYVLHRAVGNPSDIEVEYRK